MADTYTTNLNLTKPEPGAAEDTWGISLNADLDSLDAIFGSGGTAVSMGAVTLDGLTVNGVASINAGGNNTHTIGRLIIDYAGSANPKLMSEGGDQISIDADLNIVGGEVIKATSQPSHFNFKQARTGYDIAFYTAPTANNTFVKALDIASNGDISFYDDTGTSENLKWDASADTLNFVDNAAASFGASNDLKVLHTGTGSFIHHNGTGNFEIKADTGNILIKNYTNDGDIILSSDNGSGGVANYFQADGSTGETKLFHYGSEKISTTSSGISVTGTVVADNATFGTTSDSQTIVYIISSTTGESELRLGDTDTDAGSVSYTNSNDTLTFRAAAANRMSLNSSGLDVTGTVTSDGLTVDGADVFFNSGWIKSNSSLRIDIDNDNNQTDRAFFISHGNASKDIFKASENGDISFYDDTGTTQGLFWDASGERLGIGTTSPTKTLYVKNTGSQTVAVFDGGNNSAGEIAFVNSSTTGDTYVTVGAIGDDMSLSAGANERVRIKSNGNVGIGTDSPSQKLTVEGNIELGTGGYIYGDTTTPSLRLNNSAGSQLIYGTGILSVAPSFTYSGGGSERFRVTDTGFVGIGTSSPQAKLQINDGDLYFDNDSYSDSNRIGFGNPARDGDAGYIDYIGVGNFTGHLAFGLVTSASNTAATEVARFNNAGNFGIGTDSPSGAAGTALAINGGASQARLALKNTSSGDGTGDGLQIVLTDGDAGIEQRENLPLYFKTNNVEAMRITNAQRVGIGTTNPSQKLSVSDGMHVTPASAFAADTSGTYTLAVGANSGGKSAIFDQTIVVEGSVGIGTDSPDDQLVLSRATYPTVKLNDTGLSSSLILQTHSGASEHRLAGTGAYPLVFKTNDIERARLDTSGNLLVGKTSANLTTTGVEIDTNGILIVTKNAGTVAYFNRLTTDGTILDFRKDGSSVGNIGTLGNYITIGDDDTAIRFHAGVDAILPHNSSTNANRDNAISLGTSTERFKDLHLSGTAFVDAINADGSTVYYSSTKLRTGSTSESQAGVSINTSTTGTGYLLFGDGTGASAYVGQIAYAHSDNSMQFRTAGSERMRLDASGNLLVGTTDTAPFDNSSNSSSDNGIALRSDGILAVAAYKSTANSGNVLTANRTGTDGPIIGLQKSGTTVGSIGANGGRVYIGSGNSGIRLDYGTGNAVVPSDASGNLYNDGVDLGTTAAKFKDIYATNGTIQTSDINEKQDIEDLSEAETRVAVAAKGLLKKYRWKSAVADKGDDARIHFGIMAQDLQQAFSAEGLDAGDYGMFISSTWTDETTGEEKTRLGVRYNELLAFIIAAI